MFFEGGRFAKAGDVTIPIPENDRFINALHVNQVGSGPCAEHVVDLRELACLPIGFVLQLPLRCLGQELVDAGAADVAAGCPELEHVILKIDEPQVLHEFCRTVTGHAFGHPRVDIFFGEPALRSVAMGHLKHVMILVKSAPRVFDGITFAPLGVGRDVLVQNRRILRPRQAALSFPG